MYIKNVKWIMGFKNICLGLLLCGVFLGIGVKTVEGALLEGFLDGFEETLGENAAAKGERLTIGNFYQAERPDSHAPIGVMQDHTHNKGEFMFTYRFMYMYHGPDAEWDRQLVHQGRVKGFCRHSQEHDDADAYV